jgi:hypothetical protein
LAESEVPTLTAEQKRWAFGAAALFLLVFCCFVDLLCMFLLMFLLDFCCLCCIVCFLWCFMIVSSE